jgi:hypothetical protein
MLKTKYQFQRFFNIFKKAFLTPNLPPHILNLERNLLIRIGRFIGGISLLLLLSSVRGFVDVNGNLLYLIYFLSLCFFVYHCYISYHRLIFIKSKLKTSELEVRNSPLDRFGTKLLRILYCAKGYCDSAAPLGLGLGLMLGADQVLKDGGREAFFGPLLGGGLNKILPTSDLEHWRESYLQATKKLNNVAENNKIINEFLNTTSSELDHVTIEDKQDLLDFLTELQEASSSDLENAKAQALKILQDKK